MRSMFRKKEVLWENEGREEGLGVFWGCSWISRLEARR